MNLTPLKSFSIKRAILGLAVGALGFGGTIFAATANEEQPVKIEAPLVLVQEPPLGPDELPAYVEQAITTPANTVQPTPSPAPAKKAPSTVKQAVKTKVKNKPVVAASKAAAASGGIGKAAALPTQFKRLINVKATAYSGAAEENGGFAGMDAMDGKLQLGTIAVDPKVIPLGTIVYITGYNDSRLPAGGMLARAADTGSAIKGNKIDIFLPGSRQAVKSFGVQNIKLYVL